MGWWGAGEGRPGSGSRRLGPGHTWAADLQCGLGYLLSVCKIGKGLLSQYLFTECHFWDTGELVPVYVTDTGTVTLV